MPKKKKVQKLAIRYSNVATALFPTACLGMDDISDIRLVTCQGKTPSRVTELRKV